MKSVLMPAALVLMLAAGSDADAGSVPELTYRGGHTSLGNTLGVAGLDTGDVAGDGGTDILVTGTQSMGGGPGRFTLLRHDPRPPAGYRQIAFSGNLETGMLAARLLDLDGDGVHEIVIGLDDGSVHVFRGHALEPVATLSLSTDPSYFRVMQFELADADNDGSTDLVVLTDSEIALFEPATLQPRGSVSHGAPLNFLQEMAIGNVDANNGVEVVLNSGEVLRLSRNGADLEKTVLWQYPAGPFGERIGLVDFDGDGMLELVSVSDYLTTFDLDIPAPKWQTDHLDRLGALSLADVNGDGILDAIIGDSLWHEVQAIDLTTRESLWTVTHQEAGTGRIRVADIDHDGAPDLLFTAGYYSSGPDYLFAYSVPSLSLKWKTRHEDGPFKAVALQTNPGGTSITRVAFASSRGDGGYGDGTVHQWDPASLQPLGNTAPGAFENTTWAGLNALAYSPGQESKLLVGTDNIYRAAIYSLDVDTCDVTHSFIYENDSKMTSLGSVDADGDGQHEIAAGSGDGYVYLLDRSSGAQLWRSINLNRSVFGLSIADVSGDGLDDIVATTGAPFYAGFLFQFTGTGHTQWQSNESNYTSITTFDLDGDGRAEVLAGTDQGLVRMLDGPSHAELGSLQVGAAPVAALRAFRDPLSARLRLASLVDDQLRVHDVASGALIAVAPHTLQEAYALEVADVEGRGRRTDFFVGTESVFRVYCLEADTSDDIRIFAHGFDDPACSAYSTMPAVH